MKNLNKRALFLDRDGTINIEKDYVFKIADFEFQPGIFELIKHFQNQDYLVFIVTNQSGIARGFYTEKDYKKLTNWMLEQFALNKIIVTKVYHCPHHPSFSGECDCRKPKPGLIFQAANEFKTDLVNSVLIGDKKRDILAGKNAGIGKNLYIHDLITDGIFCGTDL